MRFSSLLFLPLLSLCCLTPSVDAQQTLQSGKSCTLGNAQWTADAPDANLGVITTKDKSVTLAALGNTDMWSARANAPLLNTLAPTGSYVLETSLEYPTTSTPAVAGLCVYAGGASAKPAFTFGLDHWNGSQKVKLQGLPPQGNNPNLEHAKPGAKSVQLRLERYAAKETGKPTDIYVGKFRFNASEPWKVADVLATNVPNKYVALFLKTNAAQSVTFSNVSLTNLKVDAKKLPKELTSAVATNMSTGNASSAKSKPKPATPVAAPAEPAKIDFAENPELKGKKIVFVTRKQYRSDHHNTATLFQTGEINTGSFGKGGGAMRLLEYNNDGTAKVTTLLESPTGIIRDLEVSFDGKKILFSWRKSITDDYHLYEMDAATKEVQQLTFGAGVSDIDPIYLPNGQICFSSTREIKFCMCNRHIMCNLFVMDADGANIHQIGHSTLFEGHPALLPDGRIIYDRWEYVDRNFGDAQGTWVTNPDGTNHAILWGNNTNSPGGVLDARPLPGSNSKLLCNFSSCHDRPWGAIALIDRNKGIDLRDPVIRTWPPSAIELVGKGNYDTFKKVNPKYEDPFPLTQDAFLVSRMVGKGEKMGLYLCSMDRPDLLIYEEPNTTGWGCYDPMPLESRKKPKLILPRTDLAKKTGTFYVSNVYEGMEMENVEPGEVKWLRVVESPEKRFWTRASWSGSGTQAPGMAWDDFNNKRIRGTVPVEDDGSAHFEVPADAFVYFQLLDEQGRMIHSMRSGTIVRPGEKMGCVGCHEDRLGAVTPNVSVKALRRAPDKLKDWYGKPRLFSYLTEVQPVFDKHCVKCHDEGKEGAKKLSLAGDKGIIFNRSYFQLRKGKNYVKVPGAGPYKTMMAKSWGSLVSPLAKVVLEGHGVPERDKQLNLSQEDKDRIITWIDLNAPYYPRYASAYSNNQYGRSPLNNAQLGELQKLTGVNFRSQNSGSEVFFDRPAMSPCLAKLDKNSAQYKEALAIIEQGKKNLQENPTADMPNFRLSGVKDLHYQKRYDELLAEEAKRCTAIATGKKVYDKREEEEKE